MTTSSSFYSVKPPSCIPHQSAVGQLSFVNAFTEPIVQSIDFANAFDWYVCVLAESSFNVSGQSPLIQAI